MRRLPARPSEHGGSLIEVLVAVTIFSFVAVGFAQSTMSSRRTGDTSRFESEATLLAMDKLEQLHVLAATHLDWSDGPHDDPGNPMHANGNPGGIYTRSWRVTSSLPTLGMKRIEMRISWPSPLGTRSIQLVTSRRPS